LSKATGYGDAGTTYRLHQNLPQPLNNELKVLRAMQTSQRFAEFIRVVARYGVGYQDEEEVETAGY